MSLLNLNSPAGQSPRGKKSLKMWMGAGLVVAVLGIGSTLAANITLNSPIGETEFGQGITQTVYCGGDAVVTVTPTSGYSNSIKTVTLKTVTATGTDLSVPTDLRAYKQTIYPSSSSRYPRFSTGSSTISGWWVSSATSEIQTSTTNYPTSFSFGLASGMFFVQETSTNQYKKGSQAASSQPSVLVNDDQSNFTLNGVVISNIPANCSGVNFVVSAYNNSDSEARPLISNIKLLAAKYTASSGSPTPSSDRTCLSPASGVSTTQRSTSLAFSIPNGTLVASTLAKVVVETQEDALGTNCSSS